MKSMRWGLIVLYPVAGIILLVAPAPQAWQWYLSLPILGMALQFMAEQRWARLVGLLMTVTGIAVLVVAVQSDAQRQQRARWNIWEIQKRQAEPAAGATGGPVAQP
jgi:hypothetical protein